MHKVGTVLNIRDMELNNTGLSLPQPFVSLPSFHAALSIFISSSLRFHHYLAATCLSMKRHLEELVIVPALPLSGRESVGTIIKVLLRKMQSLRQEDSSLFYSALK